MNSDIEPIKPGHIKLKVPTKHVMHQTIDPEKYKITVDITSDWLSLKNLIRYCIFKVYVETPFNQQTWTVCPGTKVELKHEIVMIAIEDTIRGIPFGLWKWLIDMANRHNSILLLSAHLVKTRIQKECENNNLVGSGILKFNITTYIDCKWTIKLPSDKYLVMHIKQLDLAVNIIKGTLEHRCMCGAHYFSVNTVTSYLLPYCGYEIPSHLVFASSPTVEITVTGVDKDHALKSEAERVANQWEIPALPSVGIIEYKTLPLRSTCSKNARILISSVRKKFNIKGPFSCQWLCFTKNKVHVMVITIKLELTRKTHKIDVTYCEFRSNCKKITNNNNTFRYTTRSTTGHLLINGKINVSLSIQLKSVTPSGCGGPYLLKVGTHSYYTPM